MLNTAQLYPELPLPHYPVVYTCTVINRPRMEHCITTLKLASIHRTRPGDFPVQKQIAAAPKQIRVFFAKDTAKSHTTSSRSYSHIAGTCLSRPIYASPGPPPSPFQPTRWPNCASSAISQAQKLEIGVFLSQLVRGKREKKAADAGSL
jgi:hypothetical protein